MSKKKLEKFVAEKDKAEASRDERIKISKIRNATLGILWLTLGVLCMVTSNWVAVILAVTLTITCFENYINEKHIAFLEWGYQQVSGMTDELIDMVKQSQAKAKETK